ncbi:MAG: alkaline phosphatase family protein [Cyanobacteria bacterium CAN_BIN43]|nr:alkaline phosphatase family protein [Cyanobacteria bacterium CAN_BIN43]
MQKLLKRTVVGVIVLVASLVINQLLNPEVTLAQMSGAAKLPVGKARLTLVMVLDGLRPDAINPTDTPNLHRLREEGVNYVNGHAVFPTVTRVNATAIGTGFYPSANGIVSNSMYVPEVNPTRSFSTGEYSDLLKLNEASGGQIVFTKTLGETLQENGLKLSVVSSGSTGSAMLLNPRAVTNGVGGSVINGYFDPGKVVAFPQDVSDAVLARFGEAPPNKDTNKDGQYNEAVDWTQDVLREYVLPELQPDVILNWLTEPDNIQHATGANSPASVNTIRNDDRNVGLVIDKLKQLGLEDKTDLFVVSDHGFGLENFTVNTSKELIDAGLKSDPNSDDVVVASSSQAVLLHVKNRDPERIQQIVKFLQQQDWFGVAFTAADRPGSASESVSRKSVNPQGWVEGTFSLDLIHQANPERGADIILTFPWTSQKNAFGVRGTDSIERSTGVTGSREGNLSGHGSMSPWNVRNTFFAWGVDFKRGVKVEAPASNVDLASTILALKGVDSSKLDGRVLVESFRKAPKKVKAKTRYFTTVGPNGYKAIIQVSTLGKQRYIDLSQRIS